ncbi:MAG: phenylalanine--tRNA ligase subunit alpha [Halobacteriota archaeon]
MKAEPKALTASENNVLRAIADEKEVCNPIRLSEETGINVDAVMQTAFMLAQDGLCEIKEAREDYYRLTEEGKTYVEQGLPEKRALLFLIDKGRATVDELQSFFDDDKESKIAINWLLRNKWSKIDKIGDERLLMPIITLDELSSDVSDAILRIVNAGEIESKVLTEEVTKEFGAVAINESLSLLSSRNLLESYSRVDRVIAITEAGKEIISQGIAVEDEITQLTPELIRTGSWRAQKFKTYDVNLPSKTVYPAKIHPYQRILDSMRRIFTEMGFVEIKGELAQSAFWNFDALFVPQDHPAREMQDTFYLATRKPIDAPEELIRNVKQMHEHGGSLNSTGWGGNWKSELGEEILLRTHTTAVTLKYLASHPEPPVKVFCIDRVYRRETIDPTHIPEFDQLEGIVMDKGVTFSHLLGYLATFYKKMGFPSIRFRPGYFPYTEPSVEVEVYMPERGWIELGGAGIFREEVTNPIGVKYPVLAWGLGIGRLAMLSLGLTDIRDLYRSDIDWLRQARVVR